MTSTIDALKNLMDGRPAVEPVAKPAKPVKQELIEADAVRAGIYKEDLRSKLRVGAWIVEFTKVDGTPAIMECTLDPKLLPDMLPSTTMSGRPETVDLLHVFAIDRDPPGWRSFKVLNVTKVYQRPTDI